MLKENSENLKSYHKKGGISLLVFKFWKKYKIYRKILSISI